MIRLLVTGSLVAAPVQRVSSKGTAYATFNMRSSAPDADAVWVSCVVFDLELVEEVMQARKGETISVAGRGELRAWTGRDQIEHHGLSCTVDRLVSVAKPKRTRTPAADQAPARTASKPIERVAAGGRVEDLTSDLEEVYR